VETKSKSSTGASLAGDYVLAAKEVKRFGDEWKVEGGIRWDRVPPRIFDTKATAEMEVENYLAEHGTLPPGSAAPEIGFTTLENETAMKLSDLRGKVVVLAMGTPETRNAFAGAPGGGGAGSALRANEVKKDKEPKEVVREVASWR